MTVQDIPSLLPDLPVSPVPASVVNRVTALFEALHSPDDAAGVQRFIPGIDRTYGLRVPVVRAIGKHVAKAYKKDAVLCTAVSQESWTRGTREHRLFALFILDPLKLSPAECWALGTAYLPGILSWEDCDQLCGSLTGRALCSDPAYMDQLETWLDDTNLWVRRAALVSTVYLRRSNMPDAIIRALDARTLAMCAALRDDPEPYIRKAVDWAIRETLRRHYGPTRDWLIAQAGEGLSRIARSTYRKSAKKLTEADQAAFQTALKKTQA